VQSIKIISGNRFQCLPSLFQQLIGLALAIAGIRQRYQRTL